MESGLTKSEVQQLVDAQEKTNKYLAKWKPLEKTFKVNLQKAYQERRKELEQELSSLERERKNAEKAFPELKVLVGNGPEGDLKKALKQIN